MAIDLSNWYVGLTKEERREKYFNEVLPAIEQRKEDKRRANNRRNTLADSNYLEALEILSGYTRDTNGGRKYDTPEASKAARKEYIRAYALVWSRHTRPWRGAKGRTHDQNRRARHRGAQGPVRSRKAVAKFIETLESKERMRCHWCRLLLAKGERTLDHIIPLAKGGRHTRENVCCACHSCNYRKGAMLPDEFKALLGRG